MTGQENERLAVVETKVTALVVDVGEIKTDVKTLLAARAKGIGITQFIQFALPFVAMGVSVWVAVTH